MRVWALSGTVFGVGDVVEPGDNLTVLVGLLNRDMGHEPIGAGSVPVFLPRLDVDHVTGAYLLHNAAAGPNVADPVGDVEGLALGVVMPGGSGARGESYVGAADG